ncbi:MAG: MFS transporter [Bdellovibrionales bacterium]|nr:MFS transporter [Bdellovibrionales bacterium]
MSQSVKSAVRSRPLLAIFLLVLVDVLAFTVVLPYLPFYAENFGASPFVIGMIITAFSLCQFLAGPVLGTLSDRFGRKPILIFSQIGTCIGFIILANSTSLWMLFLARVIDGITAGNITVAQAAMADVTKPEQRAKAFSLIGIAFGFGFFLGPGISGMLSHLNFQAPAWAAAALSFSSILTTMIFFQDVEHMRTLRKNFRWEWAQWVEISDSFNLKPIPYYFKMPQFRGLLLQFFFFQLSFAAHISVFALFAQERLQWNGHAFGPREVGYLYAYLGFLGIMLRSVVIDAMVRRFGEQKTALFGFICQGIGYSAYAWVFTVPGAILAATTASVGSGLIRPALASLISRRAAPEEQGAVSGVSQSLASIASIMAPLIAGFLLQHVSLQAWALFAGLSALIALAFSIR